jgi:hypothetical protein
MADRSSELSSDYTKLTRDRIVERKVEGRWYLIEDGINLSWIDKYTELDDSEDGVLEIYRRRGWRVTPVSVFRESR